MPHISGLRSCYSKVGRLVYFGRMLDNIRLHAVEKLPAEYTANLGDAQFYVLDGRCCRFLGVSYADLRGRTLSGGNDEEILAWAHEHGTARTDEHRIEAAVRSLFDLRPRAIMEYLDLRRPIYRGTAAFGHFGRDESEFTWERTHRVAELQSATR